MNQENANNACFKRWRRNHGNVAEIIISVVIFSDKFLSDWVLVIK